MRKSLIVIAVALVLVGAGCFPKCLKSHTKTYTVPATTKRVKSGSTYRTKTVPAHQATRKVCDEYERAK